MTNQDKLIRVILPADEEEPKGLLAKWRTKNTTYKRSPITDKSIGNRIVSLICEGGAQGDIKTDRLPQVIRPGIRIENVSDLTADVFKGHTARGYKTGTPFVATQQVMTNKGRQTALYLNEEAVRCGVAGVQSWEKRRPNNQVIDAARLLARGALTEAYYNLGLHDTSANNGDIPTIELPLPLLPARPER